MEFSASFATSCVIASSILMPLIGDRFLSVLVKDVPYSGVARKRMNLSAASFFSVFGRSPHSRRHIGGDQRLVARLEDGSRDTPRSRAGFWFLKFATS